MVLSPYAETLDLQPEGQGCVGSTEHNNCKDKVCIELLKCTSVLLFKAVVTCHPFLFHLLCTFYVKDLAPSPQSRFPISSQS